MIKLVTKVIKVIKTRLDAYVNFMCRKGPIGFFFRHNMKTFSILAWFLLVSLCSTTAQLTVSSMPLSVCGNASFSIQLGGSFTGNAGNQFRIQLSDSVGNFSNPLVIGLLNATSPAAVVCSINNLSISGVNYRIRAVSTSPASTSQPGPNSLVYHAPDLPPLNPSGQTPLCGNTQIIMFTGNRPFIQWLRNGLVIPGANSPVFQTTQTGTYTVRSGPSSGCNFLSQPTTVVQGVLPSPNQITGPAKVCPGGSINLQVQDQIIEWQRNGIVVAGAVPALVVTQPGQYRAVVQNQSGCTAISNPYQVQLDTAPVNEVKVIQGQLCVNQQAVFAGGSGSAYQWFIKSPNGQGPTLSNLPQFSFTAPSIGPYPPQADSLCLSVTGNNACSSINCFKDTIGVAPPKPGIIKNGATLISTNLIGNAWFNVATGFIPGALGRSFTATNSGSYFAVTIDPVGCKSLHSDTIAVIFTGTTKGESLEHGLFPVPANTYFSIQASKLVEGEATVTLYNLSGQRLKTWVLDATELSRQQLSVSEFPAGLYWVEVRNNSQREVSKLVIE